MKKYKESNILIVISALKKIISIFFGPFLTAYFIKASTSSLIDLSLYNIMNYAFLGIGGLIIGGIVRNKFQVGMFRIGIISNFIYILTIVLLKDDILNYLPVISFLYGFSTIAYYYPNNLFMANKINNKERVHYEFINKTVSTIIAVIVPVLLGAIITTTNFQLTAIIILFISLLQIILSFFIRKVESDDPEFTPLKSLKILLKDKDIKNMLLVDYFRGMNAGDGALDIVLIVLIFSAFKTDLNLGILSSIASIFIILMQYIYTKKLKKYNDKIIILLCSVVPVLSLFLLLIVTNNATLVLYYFCYQGFAQVLNLILDVKLFNISNSSIVKKNNQSEFWSIREVVLNSGRITGFILLLIVGLMEKFNYLYYLMIFLTLSIIVMGYFASKVKNNEDI